MKKQTYEQSMKRLEEIVKLLEKGDLPLEESMKLFEEGSKLSDFCTKQLSAAEQKVVELSQIPLEGQKDEL